MSVLNNVGCSSMWQSHKLLFLANCYQVHFTPIIPPFHLLFPITYIICCVILAYNIVKASNVNRHSYQILNLFVLFSCACMCSTRMESVFWLLRTLGKRSENITGRWLFLGVQSSHVLLIFRGGFPDFAKN